MRTPRFLAGGGPTRFTPASSGEVIVLAPGTTGFAVADDAGGAVACAVTMGRPFGLGSMTHEGGYLFPATSPVEAKLDQLALGFLACIERGGESDTNPARCIAPAATFSLMP
jgi:hypothetical protein